MLEARDRWKRVQTHWLSVVVMSVLAFVVALGASPTPSPAATTVSKPIRGVIAMTTVPKPIRGMITVTIKSSHKASPPRVVVPRVRPVRTELADFTSAPTVSDRYVVALIHKDFPVRAWHDAEAVAWCESKFRTTDIGFDSNGTHDRGLFQLNDGGTAQYLMARIGQNPNNLSLAFNPVLNVRAAAVLYARDGWSQWSCRTAI